MTANDAHHFLLVVPMGDLVIYFGDGDEDCVTHPLLDNVIAALGLRVDIRALYRAYFDETPPCTGDVHVFQAPAAPTNRLALDLYRECTDQQDLIALAVTCGGAAMPVVRRHLRALFDQASRQIAYEQGHVLAEVLRMLDATRYPLLIEEGAYLQQMHVTRA